MPITKNKLTGTEESYGQVRGSHTVKSAIKAINPKMPFKLQKTPSVVCDNAICRNSFLSSKIFSFVK